VLAAVRERASEVHDRLSHQHDVFVVEFVGSTGGGKTALAERLLDRWDGRVGVICGDVAGEDDARRYREHGVPVVNVTTGRECHLDPQRVDDALDALSLDDLDTLVIENVGNMVCPADFPLGATVRVLVVSPTEGDDVVRKHPLLFQSVDAAVVNKVDIADAVGADTDRMVADAAEVAPDLPVFRTSVETGRGIEDLAGMLHTRRAHDPHSV
jgi:hydrogenase nickel incorporation protein HypB